ncbi:MAG: acyltransferase [Bacteroidales bacterium]|jgi:peptidoglycan/LPS O-acetylase OafA/YrhL
MSKFHLHGLDSLRAIAAVVVVLGHIEIIKTTVYHLPSAFEHMPSGHTGVVLFFVISGFLITFLLLREKDTYKKISIKKFYIRRILRIWPLYYFIIFISALLFRYNPSFSVWFWGLILLPNITSTMGNCWQFSPQIWSIGVEEQFYLIWPTLIKYIKSHLFIILMIFILGYTILPHALLFLINRTSLESSFLPIIINRFFESAKFNCMAMGGMMAYLVNKNYKIVDYIRKKPFSYIFTLLPFLLWLFNVEISYFTDEVMALLFCLLIANVTYRKYWFFDNTLINYLGKISYGLYMYHWIIILLAIKWILPLFNENFILANILLYCFALIGTVLISFLSYHTLEHFFLKQKKRFELI